MKSLLLIVFSGTGNTLRVAELIRDSFVCSGGRGDIWDITKEGSFDPASYEIIGLGYPIYAFNTPLYFLRFVKTLNLENKPVFIFKTSGEPTFPNNASSFSLMKLLKKNFILGDYHFLMPYNIVFRFPGGLVKQMYLYAKKYAAFLADRIRALNDTAVLTEQPAGAFVPISLGSRFISFIFKIQWPGAAINGLFYRVNRKKCTLCMACVKNCPSKNIRLEGKDRAGRDRFRFGFHCLMCMRCSLFCPADAVGIGLINGLRINGAFGFDELEKNAEVDGNFVNEKSRGFFRLYLPYFRALDRVLGTR